MANEEKNSDSNPNKNSCEHSFLLKKVLEEILSPKEWTHALLKTLFVIGSMLIIFASIFALCAICNQQPSSSTITKSINADVSVNGKVIAGVTAKEKSSLINSCVWFLAFLVFIGAFMLLCILISLSSNKSKLIQLYLNNKELDNELKKAEIELKIELEKAKIEASKDKNG